MDTSKTQSQSNEELHRKTLEKYAPPSILLNKERDILHISPSASRYLKYPSGNPTYDIIRAIREMLRLELRTMLMEAFDNEKPSTRGPIKTVIDNDVKYVHLMVRPAGKEDRTKLALVLFIEVEVDPHQEGLSDATDENGQLRALEKELEVTKQQLHHTLEKYETSEAELTAANEELQSINEEYKSTLEELETSQEELQSVNEELQTVNAKLNHKLEELTSANNDLKNLMSFTEVATIFLNRKLQIDRNTPQVEELFNIRKRDHGRPLEHVTHKFVDYATMVSDAEEILESLMPVEREIKDEDDGWYLVRVMPYRTMEDRIEGIVITFVDITRLKRA